MYESPKVTTLGSIASLTKAYGNPQGEDQVIFGETVIGSFNGSQNGVVVPG